MPNANGIITAPVSIGDVQAVTGYGNNDLGSIIRNANINKWAKYKPVRYAQLFTANYSNWWKGTEGTCGIDLPFFTTGIMAMVEAARAGVDFYSYLRPGGGVLAPYRLADFNGYDHGAKPPIQTVQLASSYAKDDGSIPVSARTTRPHDGWLSVADIYAGILGGGDVYFGAAFVLQGTSTYQYKTSGSPLNFSESSVGETLNFDTNVLSTGNTYEVYQFLCENARTNMQMPELVNSFLPIPGIQGQLVQIVASNISVYILGTYRVSTGVITGSVRVVNNGATPVNISAPVITFRYVDNSIGKPLEIGEGTVYLNDFTVPANTVLNNPFERSGVLPEIEERGGYMFFNCTNGYQAVAQLGINYN